VKDYYRQATIDILLGHTPAEADIRLLLSKKLVDESGREREGEEEENMEVLVEKEENLKAVIDECE